MDVRLDEESSELVCGLKRVTIYGVRLRIMSWFIAHPKRIMTREFATSAFWVSSLHDRNLDTAISDLRRILRSIGSRIDFKAVCGIGYRMVAGDADDSSAIWARVLAAAERDVPEDVALLRKQLGI